ncbi:hypothetical protein [Methylocaldum sp. RMAD-M]|jgi:hypothetical protein|uniref:hypothetical protein n=1 Tax=Methylocaldum sp. RMAD-M TaxID=2806557 RepID=UPI001AE5E079|nr:hypothetical protein [Methylocaldum sp. RMAD-M]
MRSWWLGRSWRPFFAADKPELAPFDQALVNGERFVEPCRVVGHGVLKDRLHTFFEERVAAAFHDFHFHGMPPV